MARSFNVQQNSPNILCSINQVLHDQRFAEWVQKSNICLITFFFAIWWRSGCTYQQIAFHRRKMKANMRLRLGMLQRFVKLMLHKLFGEM